MPPCVALCVPEENIAMTEMHNHRDGASRSVIFATCFAISTAWSVLAILAGWPINEPAGFYFLYQITMGFFAGIAGPRQIWAAWVGAFTGQGLVFVLAAGLVASSTSSVGFMLLPIYCLPTLLSAALGAFVKSNERPRTQ